MINKRNFLVAKGIAVLSFTLNSFPIDNMGHVIANGDLELDGYWQLVSGGLTLNPEERTVFEPHSIIRGFLGHSDLKKTKLTQLDLQNVDFERADIRECDFSWTNLKDSDLSQAWVDDAHFENSIGLTKYQKLDLKSRGAFISESDPKIPPTEMDSSIVPEDELLTISALLETVRKSKKDRFDSTEEVITDLSRDIVSRGFDLNKPDERGVTLLMIAVEKNYKNLAKLLLRKKVNIEAETDDRFTALMIAVFMSHTNIVRLLISHGAEVNKREEIEENSLLHVAIIRGFSEIAKLLRFKEIAELLIENGADVNMHNTYGTTPLMLASSNGDLDLVQLLIQYRAEIDKEDNNGNTALMLAVGAKICTTGEELDEYYDIYKKDYFMFVEEFDEKTYGYFEIAKLLIDHNAQINKKNKNGRSSLSFAARDTRQEGSSIVEMLIAKGADVNSQTNRGFTPLMIASIEGAVDNARHLILHGATIDAQNEKGQTALMLAVTSRQEESVDLLVASGAKFDIKDDQGRNVLDILVERNPLSSLLLKAGSCSLLKESEQVINGTQMIV